MGEEEEEEEEEEEVLKLEVRFFHDASCDGGMNRGRER